MKIIINGKELEVEEGDNIHVTQDPCDICEYHTTISQVRGDKTIKEIDFS